MTAAALVLATTLSACGFQLRGDMPLGLKSLYVSTEAPSRVATEVRRQLAGGRVALAADPKEADAHLRITAETTEKTIRTLTSAGRVFDYQLRLKVAFRATDTAGRETIAPTQIEVGRIISYSETAPLAKEAEELLLFEDMRSEAAGQILRRVAVAHAATR
jgi:LPS-assembly lipoprotein